MLRSSDNNRSSARTRRRASTPLRLLQNRRRQLKHGNNNTFYTIRRIKICVVLLVLAVLILVTVFVELTYLFSKQQEQQHDFGGLLLRGRRQNGVFYPSAARPPKIDDYYQRKHIHHSEVPLIVGGSDGSGTRGFVQVLQDLGVTMVVEDEGTLDVHALPYFGGEGWPGLVRKVLNMTHSATYELDALPNALKGMAYADLGALLSNMEVAADVLRQVQSKQSNKPPHAAISYGFKAPVTMLLLPFFRQQIPGAFKFLHIVRDGRDVAFSDNTSPVEKFYDVFYEDAAQRDQEMLQRNDFGYHTRKQVKAMQLWKDWNQAVYEYGKKNADGETLDVLVMRSEDLLDHKYESLMKIADFVGSSLSPHAICCLSRKETKDIGKIQSKPGADDPHVFSAKDTFEAIRGRFHHDYAPDVDADSWGNTGNHQQWPDTAGDWEDIRAKMLAQHQNDKKNFQRRLLEMDSKTGRISKLGAIDYKGFSHFLHRHKDTASKKSDTTVRERYGKWKERVEGKPELDYRLHQEGRVALETFGYEPPRNFMDLPGNVPPCDESVVCE